MDLFNLPKRKIIFKIYKVYWKNQLEVAKYFMKKYKLKHVKKYNMIFMNSIWL